MRYVARLDEKCDRCKRMSNYVIEDSNTKEKSCASCLTDRERARIKWEVDNLK